MLQCVAVCLVTVLIHKLTHACPELRIDHITLQCVAVCCSVLQCIAVCWIMVQCVLLLYSFTSWHKLVANCELLESPYRCCSVLQCVAVCRSFFLVCCSVAVCLSVSCQCSHLQADTCSSWSASWSHHSAVCCSVLQCVAVCCSVLQCVAVCCSVLQCIAVCCSVFPYVPVRLVTVLIHTCSS